MTAPTRVRPRRPRSRNFGFVATNIAMFLVVLALAALDFSRGYFVSPAVAVRAATEAGITGAHITATHRLTAGLHGCSKTDAAEFDVAGTNGNGQPVHAHVCVGWPFKGATVRY